MACDPRHTLDIPQSGGVHQIGYWVEDVAAEANRLAALGYPVFATAGTHAAPRLCSLTRAL